LYRVKKPLGFNWVSRPMPTDENIHVIPLNDLREHDDSVLCWCSPKQDILEPSVWVHSSADRREVHEKGIIN
jgi:hypothetical protein